jgi:hypothetical protein
MISFSFSSNNKMLVRIGIQFDYCCKESTYIIYETQEELITPEIKNKLENYYEYEYSFFIYSFFQKSCTCIYNEYEDEEKVDEKGEKLYDECEYQLCSREC